MARKRRSGLRKRGEYWHIEKVIKGHRIYEATGETDYQRAEAYYDRRINDIRQVIVYGDRRPHLVALVEPHADFIQSYAREHRCKPELSVLARDPDFKRAIGEAITRANQSLSVIERVRRFDIVPEPFTIEGGMMTPTMKLKRPVIYRAYEDALANLYQARH